MSLNESLSALNAGIAEKVGILEIQGGWISPEKGFELFLKKDSQLEEFCIFLGDKVGYAHFIASTDSPPNSKNFVVHQLYPMSAPSNIPILSEQLSLTTPLVMLGTALLGGDAVTRGLQHALGGLQAGQ